MAIIYRTKEGGFASRFNLDLHLKEKTGHWTRELIRKYIKSTEFKLKSVETELEELNIAYKYMKRAQEDLSELRTAEAETEFNRRVSKYRSALIKLLKKLIPGFLKYTTKL